MDEIMELEQAIRQRLEASDKQVHQRRDQLAKEMLDLESRAKRFNGVASRLLDEVIRPRLERLADCFPNASATLSAGDLSREGVCRLAHSDTFPATATLKLAVRADDAMLAIEITYDLEILPVFFQFDRHDALNLRLESLDSTDDATVRQWVDSKLLQFVDTYLQVREFDQYRRDNMAVDPVCGMRIDKACAGAQFEYEGETYYFCVQRCRDRFAENPERYIPNR